MNEIMELFIGGLFDASLFSTSLRPTKEQKEFVEKNIESMEKSPEKDYVFWYNKMMIESHLLNVLRGEKLKAYLEELRIAPISCFMYLA